MADRKTPGVYIVEENAFPNSVVEVATAVPAFIGVTEKAARDNQDLTGIPTRISSMAEFKTLFGGPPPSKLAYTSPSAAGKPFTLAIKPETHYRFYSSMQIFFDNGGGPCWVTSVGNYADVTKAGGMSAVKFEDICSNPLQELLKQQEPTMIVVPDAVMLGIDDWVKLSQQVVAHCVATQSRVAILDVYNGDQKRTYDDNDIISGVKSGFRNKITLDPDSRRYAAAYYPWLDSSVVDSSTVTYGFISDDSKAALVKDLKADAGQVFSSPSDAAKLTALSAIIDKIAAPAPAEPAAGADAAAIAAAEAAKVAAANEQTSTHLALNNLSPLYKLVMTGILEKLNLMPPAAAMAGVYTRIDNTRGVFKAPANVGINSVVGPVLDITDADQEDLNVPIDGMAINAIRNFNGRGMLIWGARTLDGNSQDWRYINVRRTMIMLEQSIKLAAQAYVFEPNNAQTWVMVKSMLTSFLTDRWKEGALVGSKPEDAFSVDVGLGSTMTGNDILNGYMLVMVKVCVVRPAEFIVITFQQLMQKS
ncbi:MAG: phage tail sheath C-terminal domain-containing protein [Burkholderiaceae bacterium]|nr:phage tail sheath C-terminal domain-containing protein [Burkholderiaceae bacterium]